MSVRKQVELLVDPFSSLLGGNAAARTPQYFHSAGIAEHSVAPEAREGGAGREFARRLHRGELLERAEPWRAGAGRMGK